MPISRRVDAPGNGYVSFKPLHCTNPVPERTNASGKVEYIRGGAMSVLEVFNFTVKAERLNDLKASLEAFRTWSKRRSDLFDSMRSYHVYAKLDGSTTVECAEICEFETLAELEQNYEAVKQDKEYLATHLPAFSDVIVPGTLGRKIWNRIL
jgi:hypothetical protein